MELRHRDLGRGPTLLGMQIDGNPAALVLDRDRVVGVDRDANDVAEAADVLIDRVVDDLPHEVVKPGNAGRADVHRGPESHGLQTFEDFDGTRVVFAHTLPALRSSVAPRSRRRRLCAAGNAFHRPPARTAERERAIGRVANRGSRSPQRVKLEPEAWGSLPGGASS
jgi:hypothetical protein